MEKLNNWTKRYAIIGNAKRADLSKPNNVPAPNAYSVTKPIANRPVTMVSRPKSPPNIEGPAPGAYMIPSSIGETSKYTFSSKCDFAREQGDFPCPGSYDVPDVHNKTFKGTKFAKQLRDRTNDTQYAKDTLNVGPGSYFISGKFVGPKYGFGTSAKMNKPRTTSD